MGQAEEVEVELVGVVGLEVTEFVAEGDGSCFGGGVKWRELCQGEGEGSGSLPLLEGVVGTPVMASLMSVLMVTVAVHCLGLGGVRS